MNFSELQNIIIFLDNIFWAQRSDYAHYLLFTPLYT